MSRKEELSLMIDALNSRIRRIYEERLKYKKCEDLVHTSANSYFQEFAAMVNQLNTFFKEYKSL